MVAAPLVACPLSFPAGNFAGAASMVMASLTSAVIWAYTSSTVERETKASSAFFTSFKYKGTPPNKRTSLK
ncbi:hypothetical protein D3C87_1599690 [compost metagenome]